MNVLETNRNFLIVLGVCPAPDSKWRLIFKMNYILVLILQVLGLISSICFVVKYIRIDLNSVLYAGFHTSAYSSSTYSLLVGFLVQHKILLAFVKLQKICDESKQSIVVSCKFWEKRHKCWPHFNTINVDQVKDSSNILMVANQSGEWITRNVMKFLTLGYFLASILLAVLSALYCYLVNGFIVVEQLYVPFKFM